MCNDVQNVQEVKIIRLEVKDLRSNYVQNVRKYELSKLDRGRCEMKKAVYKYISLALLICATVVLTTGCSKSAYDGEWAYIHDDKTVALTINGKNAELDGAKCKVTEEGDTLKLTSQNGAQYEIKASDTEGQIILYKSTTYTYEGDGEPNGLVGIWTSSENWSFEFTEDGTFKEDGYFPGYYIDDTENHTFSLIYNDHFVDTVCNYSIDGNELTVQYPWPMVKPSK